MARGEPPVVENFPPPVEDCGGHRWVVSTGAFNIQKGLIQSNFSYKSENSRTLRENFVCDFRAAENCIIEISKIFVLSQK